MRSVVQINVPPGLECSESWRSHVAADVRPAQGADGSAWARRLICLLGEEPDAQARSTVVDATIELVGG